MFAVAFDQLLVVGTFWFYAFLLAVFVGLVILVNCEQLGWSALLIAGCLAALQFAGDADLLSYLVHHPVMILAGVFGYFVLGVLWSVLKLKFYASGNRQRYDELKRKFLAKNDLDPATANVPEGLKAKWEEYLSQNSPWYDKKYFFRTFNLDHNKGRIAGWVCYWPFSFFFTAFNDPLRKIFNVTFEWLRGVYGSILNTAYAGVEEDFQSQTIKEARRDRI